MMRSTAAPQARQWRFTPRTGFLCRPTANPQSARKRSARPIDAVFAELKFDVKFTIAELVLMAPNWAYVRTNSAGVTSHASTGKTTAEANQELFIFKKGEDAEWRIGRYSFSPTNPSGG
jgi:ketosteroid isomerase-like protein